MILKGGGDMILMQNIDPCDNTSGIKGDFLLMLTSNIDYNERFLRIEKTEPPPPCLPWLEQ